MQKYLLVTFSVLGSKKEQNLSLETELTKFEDTEYLIERIAK